MGPDGNMLGMADLETRLTDVLDRVLDGEHVAVERDGETVATIEPDVAPSGITVGEFPALLGELPRPDPGFADDLAEIKATLVVANLSGWPD